MATYNSFRPGTVIENPPYLFSIEGKEKYGDHLNGVTQEDAKERLGRLVMQTYGIPFGKIDEYIRDHDPVLVVERPGKQPLRWSVKRGLIEGYKDFVVATVSENTNEFGLRGIIVVNKDGEAYEAASNSLNIKKKGDTFRISISGGFPNFHKLGWEIPRKLPKPVPPNVVKELFQNVVNPA